MNPKYSALRSESCWRPGRHAFVPFVLQPEMHAGLQTLDPLGACLRAGWLRRCVARLRRKVRSVLHISRGSDCCGCRMASLERCCITLHEGYCAGVLIIIGLLEHLSDGSTDKQQACCLIQFLIVCWACLCAAVRQDYLGCLSVSSLGGAFHKDTLKLLHASQLFSALSCEKVFMLCKRMCTAGSFEANCFLGGLHALARVARQALA